jgi:IclR family KDG regulon transcriptional repressor
MARDATTSSTVLKAFAVLEAVAAARHPITMTEVAERVGVDKSTAFRMLATLEDAGYIVREPATKRYHIGYKVVSLSRNLLAENEVFDLGRKVMEQLSEITHETVHLCVLDGHETIVVQKLKGSQLVAVDFQIGDRSPLHCTSIGKALLAFQRSEQVDAVIAGGLPHSAFNTITDPDQLRAELERVRARGYAIDDHEFADTMRCIAAPVFQRDGRVQMGLSISGPDSRFTMEYLGVLRQPLLEAAERMSLALGGSHPVRQR